MSMQMFYNNLKPDDFAFYPKDAVRVLEIEINLTTRQQKNQP